MHRESVTHNTIDLLIALKCRFEDLSWIEQRVIMAIGDVIKESPFEILSKANPFASKSTIYNRIDQIYGKFTHGLVKCPKSEIYWFLETFIK